MRRFTSLLTAFSFVVMAFSGLIAFVMPQGRIAYWTNWTLFGLDKLAWGNIHIATGLLFLVAGLIHTWLNWKTLLHHFGGKKTETVSRTPLWSALALILFFSVGAVFEPPPLKQLFDFNTAVKASWVSTPKQKPPYGHAELSTLADLCAKQGLDLQQTLLHLKKTGLEEVRADATLKQIARRNDRSPAEVYALFPEPQKPKKALRYTAKSVLQQFEGSGIGRKTIIEIYQQFHLESARINTKLTQRNWQLNLKDTLKQAAGRLGITPIELLQGILIDEKIVPTPTERS